MKKLIVLSIVLLSAFACVSKKSADKLTSEKDSLAMVVAAKDSIINDVFSSINVIAENLDAIKTRENIVSANATGDLSKEKRAQINEDITAINELLIQNRETINKLKGNAAMLRKANIRVAELERLVESLNRQVADKDADISTLRAELSKMHIQVQELNTTVSDLSSNVADLSEAKKSLEATVADKTVALNTAYYIIGGEKELVDAGIVTKSGTIGRTLTINSNYDLSNFTKVDVTNVDEILVGQKRVKIVSSHPAGSYELVMSDKTTCKAIKITNPAKFWETSKVLVVSYR